MLNRGGDKMSESRAIFLNGEWKEINMCVNCPCYSDDYDDCRAESDINCISFFFPSAIDSDCPLPEWDLIQNYETGVPIVNAYVLIKFTFLDGDPKNYMTRSGFYSGSHWNIHGVGERVDGKDIKIISWRYIDG